MSKAYGLYLGCSRAPSKHRIGSWIQTSHRRHGVEPNGSVPLWKRRGVACLAPDREGHEGLNGRVPWGHTGPGPLSDKGVQRASYNENSNAIRECRYESNAKMAL